MMHRSSVVVINIKNILF